MNTKYPYVYNYTADPITARLNGCRCRIIRSLPGNRVVIHFRDDLRIITPRRNLRKAKDQ